MINCKEKPEYDQRHSVFKNVFIVAKKCDEENDAQRIHTDALVPTHNTWWKVHNFTEKKTSQCCDHCCKPTQEECCPNEI